MADRFGLALLAISDRGLRFEPLCRSARRAVGVQMDSANQVLIGFEGRLFHSLLGVLSLSMPEIRAVVLRYDREHGRGGRYSVHETWPQQRRLDPGAERSVELGTPLHLALSEGRTLRTDSSDPSVRELISPVFDPAGVGEVLITAVCDGGDACGALVLLGSRGVSFPMVVEDFGRALAELLRAPGRVREELREERNRFAGALRKIDQTIVDSGLLPDAPRAPQADLSAVRRLLSPREWEVMQEVLAGFRPASIAERLLISEHTVRNHLKSIYKKLDVGSRADLLARFVNHG